MVSRIFNSHPGAGWHTGDLEGTRLLAARLEGATLDLDTGDRTNAAHLDGAIFSRPTALGEFRLNARADQGTC